MINKIPNPQTKKFRVAYVGEFLGDFIKTFSINLFPRGKVKLGEKIKPHTTGKIPSAFHAATIDNGVTGGTGPTGPTHKLWAVGDEVVYHSYQNEAFQTGPTGGFASDEKTFEGSDLLSVGDETDEPIETTPVLISGSTLGIIIVSGTGSTEIGAQSFKANGPLDKLTISAKKVGTPVDDLEIAIQEDDDGKPDGTDLTKATIDPADLEDDKYTEVELEASDFDNALTFGVAKKYWVVFRRSGASSSSNFYLVKLIAGGTTDPYEDGEYRSYNGTNWIRIDKQEDTQGDDTSAAFPTDNNVVLGETGWTDPTRAQTDTLGDGNYSYAQPTEGASYKHVWKKFGFSLPTGAIINAVEVQMRAALSTVTYGNPPIYLNLTKNAEDKSGIEKSTGTSLTATPTTFTYGGKSAPLINSLDDTWGNVFTPDEINSDNFGIRLDTFAGGPAPADSLQYRVIWIKMKVYYYENDPEDENFMDADLKVQTSFPQASERLYLTTTKDVLFNGSETTDWQSLWRGILQKDDLNENYPAILKNLGAGGTLLLANENKVHTMIATANDLSESDENKLIFDPTHYINWIGITNSAVFGGLHHKESETLPSQVFYYEPFAERIRIFTIKEGATMGFIKDENCHIIDKTGQMRVFTGSSFQVYNYFPPYHRGEKITKLPHRNGIRVIGDIVKIAWEGQYPDPAGIWVYEDDNLYHRNSLVYDADNLNSYGAMELSELRALYESDYTYLGAGVENATGANVEGIYSNLTMGSVSDTNRGHFVTSKLISPEINNVWQDILLKYEKGASFVAKQKVEAEGVVEGTGAPAFTGTWTSATTFTSNDADFVTAVSDGDVKVGDEIIVRKGASAGLLAHITEITGTTTKTVTIDEGLATTGNFTFSTERWAKISLDYKTDKLSAKASLKDQKLENAQFKIYSKGTLEEIQIHSIVDKTIKR